MESVNLARETERKGKNSLYFRQQNILRNLPGSSEGKSVTELKRAEKTGKCSIFSQEFSCPDISRILFVRKERKVDIQEMSQQFIETAGTLKLPG